MVSSGSCLQQGGLQELEERMSERKGQVLPCRGLAATVLQCWAVRLCPLPLPGSVELREVKVAQSCLTLCDSMDCSLPDSSVHGIFQARILDWVVVPFSKGSSQSRDRTHVSHTAGGFFTIWATEALWGIKSSSISRGESLRGWIRNGPYSPPFLNAGIWVPGQAGGAIRNAWEIEMLG